MSHAIPITILAMFLSAIPCHSQTRLAESEKLESTCRIWGFLKYYHPEVATGTFYWDEQLIEILPKVKNASNREQLSRIYLDWITSLGRIREYNGEDRETHNACFDKNFNLSWIHDSTVFTSELTRQLEFIEKNRNQKDNYYATSAKGIGRVVITNEPQYKDFDYPNESYRLLCLFKYWNIIEYFFPYKYQTDQNWNDVLKEMIPKYRDARDTTEYHLALLETVAKVDDTHTPMIYTKQLGRYFGELALPIKFKIIDNKAVITGFLYKNVDKIDDLRIGDCIREIDGKGIKELLDIKSKYIPASHLNGKKRDSYLILVGHQEEAVIKYERDGEIKEKKIHRYDPATLEREDRVLDDEKWKIFDGNIGYINMANVSRDDAHSVMNHLMACKAIIIDLRAKAVEGALRVIGGRLNSEREEFAKILKPDLTYPGKFFWDKTETIGYKNKDYYKGKVILLVGEDTQSTLEFHAMAFQTAPNVQTIGRQTAGADGNVSRFELVGGFKTSISATGIFYPDGTETQRKGVKIDIEVEPTIQGIIEKRDEVLERAMSLLICY